MLAPSYTGIPGYGLASTGTMPMSQYQLAATYGSVAAPAAGALAPYSGLYTDPHVVPGGAQGMVVNHGGLVSNYGGNVQNIQGQVQNVRGQCHNYLGAVANAEGLVYNQGGAVSNFRGTVQNIQGNVSNYGGVVGNAYGQVYNQTGAVKNIGGAVQNLQGFVDNYGGTVLNTPTMQPGVEYAQQLGIAGPASAYGGAYTSPYAPTRTL